MATILNTKTTATSPAATPTAQSTIAEIAADFDRDGYVLLPQLLSPAELQVLRADTAAIVDGGYAGKENPTDYFHNVLPDTGEDVFHRVQYVFPKAPQNSLVTLLGHPFILELVQHLLGSDFVCAAEALVFKMAGNGREVPVHADCEPADPRLAPLIFNVDYYLDDANLENGCLFAAPGSHKLGLSGHEIGVQGFDFPGLIPVPARAGDVLLHNVRVVHGSHRSRGGALRRTLYYEFQSLSAIEQQGGPRPDFPVNDTWVRDRICLTMRAIDQRRKAPYAQGETPFSYRVPTGYDVAWPQPDEPVNLRPALGYNQYL
ncbi:MAG: phytanoyl-CoA dioxygenase family protein [Abitibacteriaceae bacterium]|nr:phytanoyl-CoA dioxygenase family protein [Abditibacteriaceae bacterium]MBV9863795.1 phytanoyl-CoA dioxygenase family protein [Abditibacteriaceae bacterium]